MFMERISRNSAFFNRENKKERIFFSAEKFQLKTFPFNIYSNVSRKTFLVKTDCSYFSTDKKIEIKFFWDSLKKSRESVIMTLLLLKLVFNVTFIHSILSTAFILIFACVDSQRGDIMTNNNVDSNLCVMIKKSVRSENLLIE